MPSSLRQAKLRNGSDCATIRTQEGVNEGVDRGICDVLYDSAGPSTQYIVCTETLTHLLGSTCAAATASGNSSSVAQICAAHGPCGTGIRCGCIKHGQCLQPLQQPAMCCARSTKRTVACRYGHLRQGQQCAR